MICILFWIISAATMWRASVEKNQPGSILNYLFKKSSLCKCHHKIFSSTKMIQFFQCEFIFGILKDILIARRPKTLWLVSCYLQNTAVLYHDNFFFFFYVLHKTSVAILISAHLPFLFINIYCLYLYTKSGCCWTIFFFYNVDEKRLGSIVFFNIGECSERPVYEISRRRRKRIWFGM